MMDNGRKTKIETILGNEYIEQYLFADRVIPRKCNRAEKELRKRTIRRLIVAGVSKKDVVEYCNDRFEIGEKQVNKYLSEIYDEFKDLGKRDAETNYGLAIERLEAALVDSITSDDMDNRIKVLRELDDVQGLKTHAIDVTTKGEKVFLTISQEFMPKHDDTRAGQPA